MKTTVITIALLSASVCHAQFDPNRYRKDAFFGNSGVVSENLSSGSSVEWTRRGARLAPVAVNATGWVYGGLTILSGDLLMQLNQRLVTDQGAVSVSSRREIAAFRSFGGVVGAQDGTAGSFVSWLAGRPSNSAISQFRYNTLEGYTGCNNSSFFTHDISTAGSGDDEVLDVTRGSNGTAYAVGSLDVGGGERRAFITRYLPNCLFDMSFNTTGVRIVDAQRNLFVPARRVRFNAVRIDPSGRALAVGGVQYSISGVAEGDCVAARFNANGTLDTSFDGDGIVLYRPNAFASSVRCDFTAVDFDASQRPVLQFEVEDATSQPAAGERNAGDVGIVRYNSNGSVSSTFGLTVDVALAGGRLGKGLLVLDNGDILAASASIANLQSSPVLGRVLLAAYDPNTSNGQGRWADTEIWPNGASSKMVSDLLELPGSGFLVTGYTGSTRFDHTTALLARYTFGTRYSVLITPQGTGTGTITSNSTTPAINCSPGGTGPCFVVVDEGASITLTRTPGPTSVFGDWQIGGCGNAVNCTIQINANTTITPRFDANVLTVQRNANGGDGVVSSNIGGINCGAACSAQVGVGATVTLTATPNAGANFVGWSGSAAVCGSNPICALVINAPQTAIASFGAGNQSISVSINGQGQVTSAPTGINCPGNCTASFSNGSTVTLTASVPALSAFRFDSWGGDGAVCASNPVCALSANAPRQVTATFVRRRITVTVSATGGGSVSSIPAGIANCISTCSAQFDAGSTVTLLANGPVFNGWGGGAVVCGSNTTCALSPLNDLEASASFGSVPNLIFANGFE